MSKTVFEIVEDHIMENGFDGLFNDCGCGCLLGDLMPCDSNCSDYENVIHEVEVEEEA